MMRISKPAALGVAILLAAATPLSATSALAKPAPPHPARKPHPPTELERGRYLVLSVAGCNDCHTPMTPQGPDMAHSLQGASLGFKPVAPMPWAAVAPAIAGGPIGYTRAQFVAFLRTGQRPKGGAPLPPMPAYRMNAADAAAVVAYVTSLPRAPLRGAR